MRRFEAHFGIRNHTNLHCFLLLLQPLVQDLPAHTDQYLGMEAERDLLWKELEKGKARSWLLEGDLKAAEGKQLNHSMTCFSLFNLFDYYQS